MRKLLATVLVVLGLPATAFAQLGSVPYTFSPGTTILSSEVNANFSTIYANALNRTGGTMTGTLNVLNVEPGSNNSYALGSSGNRFSNVFSVLGNFSGTLTAGGGLRITGGTAGATGTFRFTANTVVLEMGSGGFQINDSTNAATRLTLTDAGAFTVAVNTTHTFGSGGSGSSTVLKLNGSTASASGAFITFQRGGTQYAGIGDRAVISGSGTDDDLAIFAETGNGIGFMTNGSTTQKFGINSSGDWLLGSNLMDSTGTPTCNAGGCTGAGSAIAGKDYAAKVTLTTSGTSSMTLNFGHTWTTAPVCIAQFTASTNAVTAVSTTTSTVQVSYTFTTSPEVIHILCRSY